MRQSLLFLLLVCSPVLCAPPTVEAPERVFGEAGEYIFFRVSTTGKGVKVVPLDSGLTLFPSEKLKDSSEIGARATKPGTYHVLLYTGNEEGPSDPKRVAIIIGGVLPPQPKPDPVQPVNNDPLYRSLKEAYTTEQAPDRQERLRALHRAMLEAVKFANDPTIQTNQTLTFKVSEETTKKVGQSLLGVRKVIGAHLAKEFSTDVFVLTQEHRTKFAEAYKKIATFLEEIGQE